MPDLTYTWVLEDETTNEVLTDLWFDFRHGMDADEALESFGWVLHSWLDGGEGFADSFLPVIRVAEKLEETLGSKLQAADAIYSVVYNAYYSNDEDDYECEG